MDISNLLHPERLFKKNITVEDELSSIEAYNIWNTLKTRYISLETYQLFRNFVHDRDFDLLLKQHIEHFQEQINILEDLAEKLKVKAPTQPPEQIKTSSHIDALTDKIIFKRIYTDLIAELYLLSSTVSRSRVNDGLRKHFITFVNSHLNDFQNLYKYGKVKGWTEVAPSFKTDQPVKKEQLSTAEAGHLWELLNLRYDQLQLTRIFSNFVHDKDLEMILERGTKKLKDQIKTLEKQAADFELPLPEKPPASEQATIDPEIMEDKFVYRTILKGAQDAIDTHIRAVVETVRNDNLRDLFFKLYNKEVELYNDLIHYGKMKGWAYIAPKFRKS